MSSVDVSSDEIVIRTKGEEMKRKKKGEIRIGKGFATLIFVKENEVEYHHNDLGNINKKRESQSIEQSNPEDVHSRVFTFYNQEQMNEAIKSSENEKKPSQPKKENNTMFILKQINNELNELSSSLEHLTFRRKTVVSPPISLGHQSNDFSLPCSVKQKANSSKLYNSKNSFSQTIYYNDY